MPTANSLPDQPVSAAETEEAQAKGLYLVPDPSTLKPDSGPSVHIKAGQRFLAEHYEMDTYIMGEVPIPNEPTNVKDAQDKSSIKQTRLWGLLRDVKYLVKNHARLPQHFRYILESQPDFIYERAEYLNFSGLLIAKVLKIPHVYEVNWIHHISMQKFYSSLFNPVAKKLEELAYDTTDCAYFIGNQHEQLNLRSDKWRVTQNGIERSILENNTEHQNVPGDKIHACVLAKLMSHHRFDLLVDALHLLPSRERIVLHLIGEYFEPYLDSLPDDLEVVVHGRIPRDQVAAQLKNYNLALISGGQFYNSAMKLYEYAAAKLMVVCPDLQNIVNNFSDDEIKFFENENAPALAQAIQTILDQPEQIPTYGQMLFDKVEKEFTWDALFEDISLQIASLIPRDSR